MIFADWCVFITILIPLCCAVIAKRLGGYNREANKQPRQFLANLNGAAARADAAQKNSYEIFPPFAFAVLLAQFSGNASVFWINVWAALFVLGRLIYCACYIADKGALRSLAFGGNFVCVVALFICAA